MWGKENNNSQLPNGMIYCKICGGPIAKKAKICPHCGGKNKAASKNSSVAAVIGLFVIFVVWAANSGNKDQPSETPARSAENTNPSTEYVYDDEFRKIISSISLAEEPGEDTFENNQYYEVIEIGAYAGTFLDYRSLICKVLGKQDTIVSATIIAYDENKNVIEKATDEIILTAGEYNYFRFTFNRDVTEADFQTSFKVKGDSFMVGERNAVKMLQYNVSGNKLYITFQQVLDKLGTFARFKVLYYKNDGIVGSNEGSFSVYADNLDGKDSTDVVSLSVYGKDFDRIEYFFEP